MSTGKRKEGGKERRNEGRKEGKEGRRKERKKERSQQVAHTDLLFIWSMALCIETSDYPIIEKYSTSYIFRDHCKYIEMKY